jgi:hypothetical protein
VTPLEAAHMGEGLAVTLDEAVALAIAEHAAWRRQALPSIDRIEPRVFVCDGGKAVTRRPFKSRGHWRVRFSGTARLTNPYRGENGWLYFVPDWSGQ